MNDENTTIAISKRTKESLDSLKIHPNQSYEEVIQELVHEKIGILLIPKMSEKHGFD